MTEARGRLGAFALHVPFRTGSTAELWWGRHATLDLPVAVKVLRRDLARRPDLASAFRREIRAMARLDHDHVIRVLDGGDVSEAAAAASGGRLAAGAPWFAMEYAPLGSLREHLVHLKPEELGPRVAELLAGLAHAHGRDVLHLDLKPENLLLSGGPDQPTTLKLADFGLGADETATGGTPWYVAPERLSSELGPVGPRADLYAVGAIVWELVTGAPPFAQRSAAAALAAHRAAPLPPWRPRLQVAPEVEGWARRLLEKDPGARPGSAAEALADWTRHTGSSFDRSAGRPSRALLAAGVGALGSRPLPLRAETAAAIGVALRDPAATAHGLCFSGDDAEVRRAIQAAGELAHEQLGALVLHTRASEHGGWEASLAASLLARASLLDEAELNDLSLLLMEGPAPTLPPDERAGALTRAALALARRGLTALLIDDPSATPDLFGFGRGLTRAAAGTGLVVVGAAALGVSEHALTPLGEAALADLLQEHHGVEPTLAHHAAGLAQGDLLFATQLLATWAARGALEADGRGVRATAGVVLEVPGDLVGLLGARLEEVLGPEPDEVRLQVELGALLGVEVDGQLWRAALAHLGHRPSDGLLERLQGAGLIELQAGSWRFLSPRLREAVERALVDPPRRARLHAAAAEALEAPANAAGRLARLGRHRVAAGEVEVGLEHLLAASAVALDEARFWEAAEILDLCESAGAALPGGGRRRLEVGLARARLHLGRGELDAADELAGRLALEARRQGRSGARGRALRYRAMVASRRADLDQAEALLRQAEALADPSTPAERARVNLHLGTVLRQRGELDAALAALDEARRGFEADGDRLGVADATSERATALVSLRGPPGEAEGALREALAQFEALGRSVGVGYCLNTLGDLLRRRGALDEAEAAYRRARDLITRAGGHNWIFAEFNLGLVSLARGDLDAARERLDRGLAGAEQARRRGPLPYFYAALANVAAASGDLPAVERWISALRERLDDGVEVDAELRGLIADAATAARSWPDPAWHAHTKTLEELNARDDI